MSKKESDEFPSFPVNSCLAIILGVWVGIYLISLSLLLESSMSSLKSKWSCCLLFLSILFRTISLDFFSNYNYFSTWILFPSILSLSRRAVFCRVSLNFSLYSRNYCSRRLCASPALYSFNWRSLSRFKCDYLRTSSLFCLWIFSAFAFCFCFFIFRANAFCFFIFIFFESAFCFYSFFFLANAFCFLIKNFFASAFCFYLSNFSAYAFSFYL